jgi:hypothetical protein
MIRCFFRKCGIMRIVDSVNPEFSAFPESTFFLAPQFVRSGVQTKIANHPEARALKKRTTFP